MQALKGINKDATQHVNSLVDKMTQNIMFRKLTSPNEIATSMFDLFEQLIQLTNWGSLIDLYKVIKAVSEHLAKKDKMNFVVRNCSERMMNALKQICEENNVKITHHSNIESLASYKKSQPFKEE